MSNRETYQQYLLSKGLSPTQVGGILLNIEDESGFDPGVNERSPTVAGSRGGFGLFQHTGPRRAALEGYARARGKPADDWQAQLDFALTEPDMQKYLAQNYSTPGAAAVSFLRGFERPAERHAKAREQKYLGSAGYTIPASAITGDPSTYSGGGIMPVSAIPQGTLMPDTQQQAQQPQGLLGNLDPALGGLIGLSMLAGSFGGGQQGGVGGALASAIPLLTAQQKKSSEDLKSRREIQYLTSLGYSPKDAALMVHTGQKPTGATGAPTLAERKFEFDKFKYLNPKAPKPTADEALGAKLVPDGTLEEQVEAARTLGRANPAEAAALKQEAAQQKATAKRAEKAKAYESALADVDRLMELALGETDPKTGEVTPGAFTGVDSGWFDRGTAGIGNLLDRMNRPAAGVGEDAPRRSYMYQDEMSRLLAGFSTVFGEKGTQSDRDIMRQLAAMPQGDWYPDTEDDARTKLQALRDTIEKKRQIALEAGGYADPEKEKRFQEYVKGKGATP